MGSREVKDGQQQQQQQGCDREEDGEDLVL
jgi:hypothetical protein